ncbi:MAG TPA: GtrA family protein [Candidatus Saccharimonadales bacterium]|nr:GtrA family protein [Candidatus Saccharimonadales bacterium]
MFKKILIQPTEHFAIQMLRYGLVVVIAAPIDLGGYIFLKSQLHLEAVLAATISFTTSMIVNYLLSVAWVFNAKNSDQKHLDAILFAGVGFVGLALTDLIIWILADLAKINYVVAKLAAFTVVFFWNFGARRTIFNSPVLRGFILARIGR